MFNKEEYFITYITLGATLCTTLFTWTINKIYDSFKQIQYSKSERYRHALIIFYWPLYIRIIEIIKCLQLHQQRSSCNKERLRLLFDETLSLIRDKMGEAFPKKAFSKPLLDLVLELTNALHTDNIRHINILQLEKIEKLIKARLFSLASRYDSINSFEDDYNTLQLYDKSIQYLDGGRSTLPNEFIFYFFKPFFLKKMKVKESKVLSLYENNSLQCFSDV